MTAIDWQALLRLALLGAVLALAPLAWWWLRHRGAAPNVRLRALTLLTLFLTFDLVLFGAFTRLTDSGLGCPDWPGCYGSVSPIGAAAPIDAAQAAMPGGPVTQGKAWVEMVHRYLATAVGVLITVIAAKSWWPRRGPAGGAASLSPWWATLTLAWVVAQGAFGALTVTMKLYPAIVTLHLLGGVGLLVLLAVQAERLRPRPLPLPPRLIGAAWLVAALTLLQVSLGGWVSTNYAVLACRDFPTCQGQWWPAMEFVEAFTLRRELGLTAAGAFLPFASLTAIHVAHRGLALVVVVALALLAWWLRARSDAVGQRYALALVLLTLWQLATGLSNAVLGWPLLAAVAHTGGAALLALVLASMLARAYLPAARNVQISRGH